MSRTRPYRNKEWLEAQIKRGLSYTYIADYCDISRMTLWRWRKKLGTKEEEKGMTADELAELLQDMDDFDTILEDVALQDSQDM